MSACSFNQNNITVFWEATCNTLVKIHPFSNLKAEVFKDEASGLIFNKFVSDWPDT